jgi:membrane-associated phospholipid phosphatase
MTRQRTALAVLLVAAVVVYAAMWVGYRQGWGWLHGVDSSLLNPLHDVGIKHPAWVRFWEVVCAALGPKPLRLLGAVAVVVALAKRSLRVALFLVATVLLSGSVTMVAKGLADRPRPMTALVSAPSWSFPSGHALELMAGVLALLTVALPMMSKSIRVGAVAMGALIVAAVGFGRVALNVHYPSDVLAGWALGYLYFVVCVWLFRPPAVTLGVPAARSGSARTDMREQPTPEAGKASNAA